MYKFLIDNIKQNISRKKSSVYSRVVSQNHRCIFHVNTILVEVFQNSYHLISNFSYVFKYSQGKHHLNVLESFKQGNTNINK